MTPRVLGIELAKSTMLDISITENPANKTQLGKESVIEFEDE